ncbi:MAG TPA: stage V sporulation protein G [Planctomycetaceae bacterium]|nr:stage V sporulation protein G [Planctomycetaceae bacterium]
MQVTEVRIKLMEGSEDRLRAFCSITLDHSFVIRDLKVIDGASGPFVAMPSRKLSGHCYRCNYKNHLRAAYCNQCGTKLKVMVLPDAPQKLYADVAHPVNSDCREMISAAVLAEFDAELARAAQPGYRSRYDDDFEAISESHDDLFPVASAGPRSSTRELPPDAGGNNIRIDNPHETLRRSAADPPSASPRPVAGQPDPSSLPPAQTASSTSSQTRPATDPLRGHASMASQVDRRPGTIPERPAETNFPRPEGGFGAGIFD